MSKAPAFQFYPADYLADENTAVMTLEEEGAYIRALCFCWRHGSVPEDLDQFCRLIGKGCTHDVGRVVQRCFKGGSNQPGRLVHPRLELERQKQGEWSKKSSDGGKKSAEVRRAKALALINSGGSETKGGCEVVPTKPEPKGNSSSTSTDLSKDPPLPPLSGGDVPVPKPARRKRVRAEKYRELVEADFDWPPAWQVGAKLAMKEWVDYKAKAGHPAILETYRRQMVEFAGSPRHFAALVSRAIRNGWQGLNEQLPLEPAANGNRTPPVDPNANRPRPAPFVPPPPKPDPTPEEKARVRAMIEEKLPKVRGIP